MNEFQRDERSVKRWQITRGLLVHRVPGGGRASVYANTDEVVEWLKGKNVTVEADAIPNLVAGSGTDLGAAGSVLPVGNGHQTEVSGVEWRVGQRRTTERNGGP